MAILYVVFNRVRETWWFFPCVDMRTKSCSFQMMGSEENWFPLIKIDLWSLGILLMIEIVYSSGMVLDCVNIIIFPLLIEIDDLRLIESWCCLVNATMKQEGICPWSNDLIDDTETSDRLSFGPALDLCHCVWLNHLIKWAIDERLILLIAYWITDLWDAPNFVFHDKIDILYPLPIPTPLCDHQTNHLTIKENK